MPPTFKKTYPITGMHQDSLVSIYLNCFVFFCPILIFALFMPDFVCTILQYLNTQIDFTDYWVRKHANMQR